MDLVARPVLAEPAACLLGRALRHAVIYISGDNRCRQTFTPADQRVQTLVGAVTLHAQERRILFLRSKLVDILDGKENDQRRKQLGKVVNE